MNLKSFGCSFIYGTDLPNDNQDFSYSTPSHYTWPALLAKSIDYQYSCYARPGSGNLQILEQVLTQVAVGEHALYVIGWTWIDRFDYNNRDNDSWRTIMPVDVDPVANMYYKDLHSQYRDKLTTLINIKLAIDTLIQKDCPFIMTYMDELIFETEWHTTSAIGDLQDYIRPHMTQFDNKTFLEFSKEKGFPISETLHPLKAAHQAGFELIKPRFDTILHKA